MVIGMVGAFTDMFFRKWGWRGTVAAIVVAALGQVGIVIAPSVRHKSPWVHAGVIVLMLPCMLGLALGLWLLYDDWRRGGMWLSSWSHLSLGTILLGTLGYTITLTWLLYRGLWRVVTSVAMGFVSFFLLRDTLEAAGLPAGGTADATFESGLLVVLPPVMAIAICACLSYLRRAKEELRTASRSATWGRRVAILICGVVAAMHVDARITPPTYIVLPVDHTPTHFRRSGYSWSWLRECTLQTHVSRPLEDVLEEIMPALESSVRSRQDSGNSVHLKLAGPEEGSARHHSIEYWLTGKGNRTTSIRVRDRSTFDH